MSKNLAEEYWKKNLKYLLILLSIWFTVSFGFGIILIDELNQIKIGGFKLRLLVCSARLYLCISYYVNICVYMV